MFSRFSITLLSDLWYCFEILRKCIQLARRAGSDTLPELLNQLETSYENQVVSVSVLPVHVMNGHVASQALDFARNHAWICMPRCWISHPFPEGKGQSCTRSAFSLSIRFGPEKGPYFSQLSL
jgi:hypothetical protein